ncbi:translation initiation factor IF-2-like [Strigops habroptila]|uniref:translation initiation factor IF-2-like n=1 Tax=Strigops habroptila TaxID=2489341 RepID=UPI0011CFD11E|nr:translation initiation factor IF-2-like [Strigops habroptila]
MLPEQQQEEAGPSGRRKEAARLRVAPGLNHHRCSSGVPGAGIAASRPDNPAASHVKLRTVGECPDPWRTATCARPPQPPRAPHVLPAAPCHQPAPAHLQVLPPAQEHGPSPAEPASDGHQAGVTPSTSAPGTQLTQQLRAGHSSHRQHPKLCRNPPKTPYLWDFLPQLGGDFVTKGSQGG